MLLTRSRPSTNSFQMRSCKTPCSIRSNISHPPEILSLDREPFFVLITLTQFYHPSLDGTQSMNPTSWQLDAVFSSILAILNSSLATSAVLSYFKQAIVQPLVHTPVLKKPGLDPTVLNSFRPVSKLLFYTRFYKRMF